MEYLAEDVEEAVPRLDALSVNSVEWVLWSERDLIVDRVACALRDLEKDAEWDRGPVAELVEEPVSVTIDVIVEDTVSVNVILTVFARLPDAERVAIPEKVGVYEPYEGEGVNVEQIVCLSATDVVGVPLFDPESLLRIEIDPVLLEVRIADREEV